MQFIILCFFQILADYDNSFVFIIQLIVLELYDVMRGAVEKVNFEKCAILVSSLIPFHMSV